MTNFQWRPATDSDRPFIAWMDELTETFGDESQPLPEDYVVTRRKYVDQWDASQGGVILFATSLDDADLELLSGDMTRTDPFEPRVSREVTYSAAAIKAERLECGDSSSSEEHEGYEVPVGAAWLRTFTKDDPGYGFVENGIPEVAIALRPGVVGRRLSQPMIAGLLEYARELGYPGVSLAVHDANPRAAKAYVKAGFELVGRSSFPDHDVMVVRF